MQDISSINLKRGITIGVISAGAILIALSPSNNALAEGVGSSAECNSPNANLTGNDNLLFFTAPDGNIIDGVCIKSGDNMFLPDKHSALLGNGTYENSCYSVTGIGTPNVTIERIGTPSDTCQGLSHVDVFYSTPSPSTTPSPTPTPSSTPAPSATPSPTPTASATPTPEPSSSPTSAPTSNPESTPTPTPSPTPSSTPTPSPAPSSTPTVTPTSTPSSNSSNTSSSSNSSNSSSDSSPTIANTGTVLGASVTAPISTPLPGAVLGASAQLPETGPETTWILMGVLSLLSGSGLLKMGLKRD